MILSSCDRLFYKKGILMPRLRKLRLFLKSIISKPFTFHLIAVFSVSTFSLSFLEANENYKSVGKVRTVTLVEYFDFSCPLSAQSSKSLKSFKDKVGSRVSIVRKSLAFSEGGFSWIAGKYYHALLKQNRQLAESFYRRVFEQTLNGELNEPFLENIITELGVDLTKFKSALKSPFLEKQLRQNEFLANKSGIFVSPGYTLGGQVLLGKQEPVDFGKFLSLR